MIKRDRCGDLIVPETSNSNELLKTRIVKILTDEAFYHDGWIQYYGYPKDAASYIVSLIEKMGYLHE